MAITALDLPKQLRNNLEDWRAYYTYYTPRSLKTTKPNYPSQFMKFLDYEGYISDSRSNVFAEGNGDRTECK